MISTEENEYKPAKKSDKSETMTSVQEFEEKPVKAAPRRHKYLYGAILSHSYFHISAIIGFYVLITSVKRMTIILNIFTYNAVTLGLTAGAHRLWAHRSYKAKLPLQIILMLFHSMAFQYSVINWATDHRLHHKHSDTDADPHNANRGFFFSHIGWLLIDRTDEAKKQFKQTYKSDIENNPVLKFQRKYAYPVIGTMGFLLPTVVPMIFWGETFYNAWHMNMLRYVLNLHATFCSNSVAHKYGSRPYNKNILPTENYLVSFLMLGEGFHNYHHAFPWDYRAAEVCNYSLNMTALFIDLCAWIGWAYDLKTVDSDVIRIKSKKSGDGTGHWETWDFRFLKNILKHFVGKSSKDNE